MSDLWKKIKGWKGWSVVMTLLRTLPKFLFKTRTGRVLVGLLLSAAGVTLTEDELKLILEIAFSIIALLGNFWANEPTDKFINMLKEDYAKRNTK